MSEIRVTHFVTSLNHGGAEIMILNLCRELQIIEPRYKFTVISVVNRMELESEFKKIGVAVYTLDGDNNNTIRKIILGRKLLKQLNTHIVHTHTLPADQFGVLSALASGISRIIVTDHNMTPSKSLYARVVRGLSNLFAQKIIAVSNAARNYYIAQRYYRAEKISVIYTAPGFIQPENIRHKQLPSTSLKAINVGRIDYIKGHANLIAAFNLLKSEGLSHGLSIYGKCDDNLQVNLKKDIQSNLITFFPPVNNIHEKMQESDVYISGSLSEACPLTVLEAMSLGLPLIITDIPAHNEILSEYPGGYPYFVPVNDPNALALAIIRMSKDENEYAKISTILIALSQKFSLDKMISNYHVLYSQTMNCECKL